MKKLVLFLFCAEVILYSRVSLSQTHIDANQLWADQQCGGSAAYKKDSKKFEDCVSTKLKSKKEEEKSTLTSSISRADFNSCLKSISTNSVAFLGKIFPLSADGWSYAVSDLEKKETTIYLENGETYKISPTNSVVKKIFDGPQACKNVTTSETKNSSGVKVVNALYKQAINDKKTSLEARKKIYDACRDVSLVADMPQAAGFMMNGVNTAPPAVR